MRRIRLLGIALPVFLLISVLTSGSQEQIYWGNEVPERWAGEWPEPEASGGRTE